MYISFLNVFLFCICACVCACVCKMVCQIIKKQVEDFTMLDVEMKKSAKRQEDRYETEEYFLEIFDIAS